jgi:predicted O-methyltransferase YrrM
MDLINNKHMQAITSILKNIGERVEGNLICDIEPDCYIVQYTYPKIKNLQELVKNKKKIIEIGVNACHSLLIMLLENPNAEYLLFDLKYHTYTEPTLNYVKEQFPNTKINIIYGNSVETIEKYIQDHPEELKTYDLCHLDGGHTEDIFSKDYDHTKQLLAKDGITIFDDYNYEEIYNFLQNKINTQEIKEYKNENIKSINSHFVYQYL